MKQVLQELGSGRTVLADVPAPMASSHEVMITTRCSLISAGTERMLVEFGRAGWLDKIRQQPAKVRQVLDKITTDGVLSTLAAVRSKLDQPLPLGYCNVGVVTDVGSDAFGFTIGDRVVSNGPHAEIVAVPRNLCARIPDGVTDEAAAFTVVGAIGLQGIRLAAPTLGESFVVTGLGLIGLITVQLLRANGCRVLGIDPDPAKTLLARQFGATTVELASGEDPLIAAEAFSRGRGVDGVIVTAATKSNEPISQAARMSRQRGRIVLVGVAGLELERADFYEKELSFQVSCSYGPGRYDPTYEEQGTDYPYGFVRWTEQRNFEAVLDMMAAGALDMASLISHRFAIEEVGQAYDLLVGNSAPYMGIMLNYHASGAPAAEARGVQLPRADTSGQLGTLAIGVVGAGNYAGRMLIPAFARTGARLLSISSSGGVTAAHHGRKHGFLEATTDTAALISDERIEAVVIATRHDSHAQLAVQAIHAGKHVFVEKPLGLTRTEIDLVSEAWLARPIEHRPQLMVGFNRRFAPHTIRIKSMLANLACQKTFVATINAGAVPANHWTQDPLIGGGRIVGEACHFVDLLRFLAGAAIESWHVTAMRASNGVQDDKCSIVLSFADGSVGTIHYLANGNAAFPKERIEVFCAGRILQLDNFRRLRGYGWKGFKSMNLWRQDKGQAACAQAFVDSIGRGIAAAIPFDELIEVSRVTIGLAEAARR